MFVSCTYRTRAVLLIELRWMCVADLWSGAQPALWGASGMSQQASLGVSCRTADAAGRFIFRSAAFWHRLFDHICACRSPYSYMRCLPSSTLCIAHAFIDYWSPLSVNISLHACSIPSPQHHMRERRCKLQSVAKRPSRSTGTQQGGNFTTKAFAVAWQRPTLSKNNNQIGIGHVIMI